MRRSIPSAGDLIWGLLFIGCGLFFLAPSLGFQVPLDARYLWPWFLIIPGLGLWGTYLSTRPREAAIGLVIPATIVTLLGTFFLFSVATDWKFTGQFGFVFPLIAALSFWAAWLLGTRHIGFLIPAVILSTASAAICVTVNLYRFLIPGILIGTGCLMMLRGRRRTGPDPTIDAAPLPAEDGEATAGTPATVRSKQPRRHTAKNTASDLKSGPTG